MKRRWEKIKNQVLGKEYDLSLVFADNVLMKELNKTYRKKGGSANVLSFPLSKTMGEIFINKKAARPDYLFLHSLLHLRGFEHGRKMDDEEKKIIKNLKLKI